MFCCVATGGGECGECDGVHSGVWGPGTPSADGGEREGREREGETRERRGATETGGGLITELHD